MVIRFNKLYATKAEITHTAFFDIEIDGVDEGRLILDLFGKDAPKTVNNFLGLCMAGYNKNLSYWNCKFHKIASGYIFQGGDIMYEDGTGA